MRPNPTTSWSAATSGSSGPTRNRIYAAMPSSSASSQPPGSIGEWQNWLLFTHSVSFGVKDPQFHKDVSFYVFHLPFLEFLVNWFIVAL